MMSSEEERSNDERRDESRRESKWRTKRRVVATKTHGGLYTNISLQNGVLLCFQDISVILHFDKHKAPTRDNLAGKPHHA